MPHVLLQGLHRVQADQLTGRTADCEKRWHVTTKIACHNKDGRIVGSKGGTFEKCNQQPYPLTRTGVSIAVQCLLYLYIDNRNPKCYSVELGEKLTRTGVCVAVLGLCGAPRAVLAPKCGRCKKIKYSKMSPESNVCHKTQVLHCLVTCAATTPVPVSIST